MISLADDPTLKEVLYFLPWGKPLLPTLGKNPTLCSTFSQQGDLTQTIDAIGLLLAQNLSWREDY